jgi:hypothetical protein
MNHIAPAQVEYFKEVVASFKKVPYSKWEDLWIRPPNPACLNNLDFEPSKWHRMPICMFSPGDMWRIGTPCARHGWDHSDSVQLVGWRQRLVKGVYSDFTLGSRKCICSKCRKEHTVAKLKLTDAKKQNAPAAQIEQLQADLKQKTYVFSTINPMVTKYYMERYPWVAMEMPAVVTHRAALSTEVLYMLQRSARTAQGSSDLESQLSEFRGLVTAHKQVSFYSLQRWHRTRSSIPNLTKEAKVQHYEPGISTVSDTYLTFVLKQWYFSNVEKYLLQWFEQHCPIDICQSDHHCKRFYRQRQDGSQLLGNRFTV